MRLLNKVILALAVVLAIGVGVAVAAAITSTSFAGTTGTTDGATTIGGTSSTLQDSTAPVQTGTGDVSGPCDEAEHANDPQCSGAQTTEDNDDVAGVDVSGPCDEAEHADDPRCTGAQTRGDDDENNSGPSENSGPGNADEDSEDNSGPGNADEDLDDDSGSGESGHSGSGEDDSGP